MARQSAGILLYRFRNDNLQFLLVHPGGPLHAKKDIGAWSIPKGEFGDDEDPLAAARREFAEETGQTLIQTEFIQLTPVKQKGGKTVHAWAAEGDIDVRTITSNIFKLQWPPRSGKWIDVPEVDKADWFSATEAAEKINPAQVALIYELMEKTST